MSRWWVTFTKRLGYPSQDMLLVGRSHSVMCAPPGQMCPYCFQSEFQAFGAETKLNFLTCVPVEANKESSLHFLKCSVLFTSPKTQQEKFICWLGELEGGFSRLLQNWILILRPLFLVSKWELLGAKLFQLPLCSGDIERQEWRENMYFCSHKLNQMEPGFLRSLLCPQQYGQSCVLFSCCASGFASPK